MKYRHIAWRLATRLFLPGILIFLAAAPALAQFDTATVLGTIRDSNGGTLSGVKVRLKNTETGITTVEQTNSNGDFVFTNVKIGSYQLTAEAQGFSSGQSEKFAVSVNARQRVDLALQVGASTEVINVTGSVQLLETDSSVKGQVVEREQIVNLPLNGRSYAALALLAPGVRESQSGNQGNIAFRREGSFNINGLRSTYNNFILDGIDNNFYGTTNQGFSNQAVQPSPDAVAEFKLMTNTYSAEFGRTGGAVFNVSYRSGTNEFHGTVWNFLRNTSLNATGFFRPAEGRKPQVNRNQFGFVFGGPIVKDRTFFFVDYEGSRWIQSPFALLSLPSNDMRAGVLPVDVRAPFDFTDSNGRRVTAGTVFRAGTPIPMTTFARRVLDALPQPNRPAVGAFGIGNNFGNFDRNRLFEDKGSARVDHKFNDRLTAFARYSYRSQTINQPGLIPGLGGGNGLGFLDTFNQQGVAGVTYVLPNNSVLEVRYAITRLGFDRLPQLVGGPSMRELFGITGLPEGPRIQGGITPQDIIGFPRLGRQSTNPQAQFPTTNNLRVNYGWTVGRHTLKTGYEFFALNQDVDDTNPLYGIDIYQGGFSRPNATVANNAFFGIADFYFGARSQYQIATQKVTPIRQRGNWWYFQDDIRVTDKLTVNAGVRYELTTPLYDANNELANFDPVTRQIVVSTGGSISDRSLRNLDKNNFAPRIGFAYRIADKTVVRGGYAIGYNYWNRMAGAELLSSNFPFVTRTSLVNPNPASAALCTGDNFSNCFRPTQAGYPVNRPNNFAIFQPRDFPWGYVQNWHLSVQRELFRDFLLEVAYVGNKGVKLPRLGDLNQARPLTAQELALPAAQRPSLTARRPFQGFETISANLPVGNSNYHGLQAKVQYRSNNLNLLSSFTYSKAIDDASQVLEVSNGSTPNPQDINNLRAERGPSAFDQKFNSTTSVVYQLPIGRGQKFGRDMNPVLDAVIGGWSANTIVSLTSGQPINLWYQSGARVTDNQPDFLGGVTLRPNVSGDPLAPEGQRTFANYFNRANITIPTEDRPFGNAGRNSVRGFAFYNVDFGIQKGFRIPKLTEQTRLEFRAEFFNFFNRTNFNAPVSRVDAANFGQVTSTFDPRTVQLALKLYF